MRLKIFIYLMISILPAAGAASDIATFSSDTSRWLGGVTVTAIKQNPDLSLQPLAATVLDRKQVEKWDINSLRGVSEIAPNFLCLITEAAPHQVFMFAESVRAWINRPLE